MRNSLSIRSGILLFMACISVISCERKDPQTNQEDIGGKGGSATLKITSQHHGKNIDSATIYIKYNTQDKPTSYDDSMKCVIDGGKAVATFIELKKGKYYLYGKGWDKNIENYVEGGIPYVISEEKTVEIVVPVTEGD
jgi:hypothetical protein